MPNATAIIRETLDGYLVPDKTYPDPLPADLAPWYCYVIDSGHCVVVVPQSLTTSTPTADHTIPVPVRQVLRLGWQIVDGWVVCDVTYDPNLGVVAAPGDTEF